MDSKGAQELAKLLEERNGPRPSDPAVASVIARDAAPIFHWLGIEPPASGSVSRETDAT
jgi:hypothetical protein